MNGLRYGAMALALTTAAFAGCGLGDAGRPASGDVTTPTPGGSSSGTSGGPTDPTDCVQPACQDVPLPETPHILRLTNSQWELTTRDLLRLDEVTGKSVDFSLDPQSSIGTLFGIDSQSLYVDGDRFTQYQAAAVSLAKSVVADAVQLNKVLPLAAQDVSQDATTRYAAFVADFLPRAYRRPVTPAELAAMTTLADGYESNATSGDPFQNRVTATIKAVLQSPFFLYRVAGGEDTVTNHRARLTAYELASKLSYGLWNTMPDDALFAHAKAGDLATTDGAATVAREMLTDPRATANLVGFHDELYATGLYAQFLTTNSRDTAQFPTYYAEFAQDAVEDIRRSVAQIVFAQNGGMKELQTSSVAFVNKRLASVYGIDPATIPELAAATGPDTWVQVTMDPSRKGILMHPGWLAYEGTGTEPSSIHRGVYMARHVICQPLGNPPAAAAGADPAKAKGDTNRDRVIATTAGCGDLCHGGVNGVINPLGFGFENFDSIGKLRTTDDGFPIDTTGSITALGPFTSGPDMLDKIGDDARAHACYAAHWVAYLNNATSVDVTPKWLSPAVAKSLAGGSVRDVLIELVKTDAFLTVSR